MISRATPRAARRRSTTSRLLVAAALLLASGCGGSGSPTPTTGLTGTVLRGPVTPVCTQNVACDAPFSAGFTVQQNGRRVAQFRSDADGHFTVNLDPGAYAVVPDPDAPVVPQSRSVDVGAVGLTTVTLRFDTGIR